MSNRRKTPAERRIRQQHWNPNRGRELGKLAIRRGMLLRDANRLPSWAIHHEPKGQR